eukprot:s434_g23.t1
MKIQNPGMKFRIEMNIGCLETITTSQQNRQGLKANKSFFVEIDAYRLEFGEPEPHEITYDYLPDGTKCQGVNVSLGKAGWWKRVNERTNQVKREAQLTEESAVDPTGEALDHIQAAAKRAVIRDIRPVRFEDVPMVRRPKPANESVAGSVADKDDTKSKGSDSESEENTGGIRMMSFLNRYAAPTTSPSKAGPKGKARPKASSASAKQQARTSGPIGPKSKTTSKAKNENEKGPKESTAHKTVVGNAGF